MISIRLWMHLDFSTDGKVVRSNGKRWFPDRTTPELTTKLAHPLFVRDSEAPRECRAGTTETLFGRTPF